MYLIFLKTPMHSWAFGACSTREICVSDCPYLDCLSISRSKKILVASGLPHSRPLHESCIYQLPDIIG